MMTIEQLDAVPIGGKVKSEAFTFTRWSNETWNFFDKDLEDVRHSNMRVLASKLSPLTEPQTWQDVVGCENCEYRLALQRIVLMYEPWTSARSLAEHVLTGGTVEGWQES